MKVYIVSSTEETEEIGSLLAQRILKDDLFPTFIALYGDLGAGKTAFVRGFARVMSPGSRVKSPTYTIVNEYHRGKAPVFHFDLYRISSSEELDSIGFDDYLHSGHCIAEWCERLGDNLPKCTSTVTIEQTGENERRITVAGLELDTELE